MSEKIYPGTTVRLSVTFTDAANVIGDPSGVLFKIRQDAGQIITSVYGVDPEIIREGPGQYHMDIAFQSGGLMRYRWEGSGTLVAATEGFVQVECSAFV